MSNEKVLRAKDISIVFGGLTAVDHFNMEIGQNELVGLIIVVIAIVVIFGGLYLIIS